MLLLLACVAGDTGKPPDDADPCPPQEWYQDDDGDGYGDVAVVVVTCEAPPGFVADATDCDEADAGVHPDADEHCDGRDEDCDEDVDEAAVDAPTWFVDADGDGVGGDEVTSCEVGGVEVGGDCDDADPAVAPGVDELCNERDDDCDGEVDEDAVDVGTWFVDVDGDGYGAEEVRSCAPAGVEDGGDCDDLDPALHPDAEEACDEIDNNCNGVIDEATPAAPAWYADADGDGYGDTWRLAWSCEPIAGALNDNSDCDDTDPEINPAAEDLRANKIDEDCDGDYACYGDGDGDGSIGDTTQDSADTDCRDKGEGSTIEDCDDADATISPDEDEVPYDGVDQDCDGADLLDVDGDGYDGTGADCADDDPDISPAATEICDREDTDEDCDGLADEADPDLAGGQSWYVDADGDGFGDPASAVSAACQPAGLIPYGDDCDDTDAAIHPGAEEACDTTEDQNCDGLVGSDDHDGDGLVACEDCDDRAPLAEESINGADDDCDGLIDEYVGNVAITSDAEAGALCATWQSIEGELHVIGLEALDGLYCLRSVSGRVRMDDVSATDFTGLGALTTIGGDFLIGGWQEEEWPLTPSAFTSFAGLDRLRVIGGDLRLDENEIGSFDGLDRLDTIGGSLSLTGVPFTEVVPAFPTLGGDLWLQELPELTRVSSGALTALGGSLWLQEVALGSGGFALDWPIPIPGSLGLAGLPVGADMGWTLPDTVGALYVDTTELTDLDGLDDLRAVDGDLVITSNRALVDISALDALTSVGGDLSLISNTSLPNCGGFLSLTSIGGWLRLDGAGPTTLVGFPALTTLGTGLELQASTLTAVTGFDALTTTPTLHLSAARGLADAGAIGHIRFTTDVTVSAVGTPDLAFLASTGPLSGGLSITGMPALTSFAGAEGITSIGAALTVEDDDELASFDGLDNLATITGAVTLSGLPVLTRVDLPGLVTIGGDLALSELDAVTDLDGLTSLTSLGGLWIADAPVLADLGGLRAVETIAGNLILQHNAALTSLAGLATLREVGGNVTLSNTVLGSLVGLDGLEWVGGSLTLASNRYLVRPDSLGALARIEGDLWVEGNRSLVDMSGLGALTIGGALYFFDNDTLGGLDGLEGVTDVGGNLVVADEDLLLTLEPLGALTHVGGDVRVGFCQLLPDLHGLEALTTVDGDVDIGALDGWAYSGGDNTLLTTLDGLESLTTIGGDLRVTFNPALEDISALDALTTVGDDFTFNDNSALPTTDIEALAAGIVIGGDTYIRRNL